MRYKSWVIILRFIVIAMKKKTPKQLQTIIVLTRTRSAHGIQVQIDRI